MLALDRFGVAHDRGSSHGLTRIIRLAYFEHPSYVPLLVRAFTLWRELESAAGETVLRVTGAIDAGPPGSRIVEGALKSVQQNDLRHEVLSAEELSTRAPGYRLPVHYRSVWQPDGGILEPEACIAAHLRLARKSGADVRPTVAAAAWEPTDKGVRVRSTTGEVFDAAQLVVCAGAWTAAFVPSLA